MNSLSNTSKDRIMGLFLAPLSGFNCKGVFKKEKKRGVSYSEYIFINHSLKSYGYAYKIDKNTLKWGIIIFSLCTPFSNLILIPLALKIKQGFYIRTDKRFIF